MKRKLSFAPLCAPAPGLAPCREIAESHGGHIRIERNDPEKGITVFPELPDGD